MGSGGKLCTVSRSTAGVVGAAFPAAIASSRKNFEADSQQLDGLSEVQGRPSSQSIQSIVRSFVCPLSDTQFASRARAISQLSNPPLPFESCIELAEIFLHFTSLISLLIPIYIDSNLSIMSPTMVTGKEKESNLARLLGSGMRQDHPNTWLMRSFSDIYPS